MDESFVIARVGGTSGVLDVVLVHGLTGDLATTWTSRNSGDPAGDYWPKWLCGDFPNVNVYTLGYPASLFEKWAKQEMNLYERAKATLECLASYEFGERPIVFISHSLGGLLVKQILKTGYEIGRASCRERV